MQCFALPPFDPFALYPKSLWFPPYVFFFFTEFSLLITKRNDCFFRTRLYFDVPGLAVSGSVSLRFLAVSGSVSFQPSKSAK